MIVKNGKLEVLQSGKIQLNERPIRLDISIGTLYSKLEIDDGLVSCFHESGKIEKFDMRCTIPRYIGDTNGKKCFILFFVDDKIIDRKFFTYNLLVN